MAEVRGGFGHERLEVYRLSLELVEEIDRLAHRFRGFRKHLGWQMHKAVFSVPLNIAEANGRRTGRDKAHYLVIATGSAFECAAAIDVATRLEVISPEERQRLRDMLLRITRMLIKLTHSVRTRTDPDRDS